MLEKRQPVEALQTHSYKLLDWFMPYDEAYRGGIDIAVANIDANNYPELIILPRAGGSNVRLYEYSAITGGMELYDWFMAYDENYRGSMNVRVADLDGDGASDIVFAPKTGGPNVRVYRYVNATARVSLHYWFWGFDQLFAGGVKVVTGR